MEEEDYQVLRNAANADPEGYTQWDPHRQFRSEYAERHRNDPNYQEEIRAEQAESQEQALSDPMHETVASVPKKEEEEEVAPLSRHTSTSSSTSSASSNSAPSARLEEIRTAHSTPARDRRPTVTSQASSRK